MPAIIAIMISFIVLGIGYIVNKLIPGIGTGWLQTEYWEVAKSVLLVGGIFSILSFLSSVAYALTGNTVSSNFQTNQLGLTTVAENYLGGVGQNVCFAAMTVTGISVGIGFFNGFDVQAGIPINVPLGPFSFGFATGFSATLLVEPLLFTGTGAANYQSVLNDEIAIIVLPLSFLIGAQQFLLPFIILMGLAVFLPLGLFFRAFPFTRNAGGTLVAISIGLAIVYPSLLALFNAPITNSQYIVPYTPDYQQTSVTNALNTYAQNSGTPLLGALVTDAIDLIYPKATAASVSLGALNDIYSILNVLSDFNLYLVIQYILILFDILIFYAIVDSIAKVLGGSLKFSLTGKLKLG